MTSDGLTYGWDGSMGRQWAEDSDRYDRMSGAFLGPILGGLDVATGETVLDVGCGNGALSLALARSVGPTGRVTGLDISTPMLEVARRRVVDGGAGNVTFVQGDAQRDEVPGVPYDAFTSRFGVMFFDDPVAAFANLTAALRPGGRVAFACWRQLMDNDWIMVPAAAALEHVPMPELGDEGSAGPFTLADPDHVRTILERAGLTRVDLEPVDVPVVLGSDVEDAIEFMRRGEMANILFTGVEPSLVEAAWDSIRGVLAGTAGQDGVSLKGAAWLVTARRP